MQYGTQRRDLFLSPTDFGYVGIRFVSKDYGYFGTMMEFCVRHDIVNDAFNRATEAMGGWGGWKGKALDELKKDLGESESFRMSYNAIVGNKEHTTDDIKAEEEIPAVCERWLKKCDETADRFFSRFTNIETIADMFVIDDPFLHKLFNSDFHRTVGHGVATLRAVRGLEAANIYAKRHEQQMTGTIDSCAGNGIQPASPSV